MENVLEQFQVILDGISWQLIVAVLAAAALTEQIKRMPWLAKAEQTRKSSDASEPSSSQKMVMWGINAFMPEAMCVSACLWIPGVLPEGVSSGIAIMVGYFTGTVSSKLHSMVLNRAMKKIGSLLNGKDESGS